MAVLLIAIALIVLVYCGCNKSSTVCIRINNSCDIWSPKQMKTLIQQQSAAKYGTTDADHVLNRSYTSMYIEWWCHNIGYYITKPFCFIEFFRDINIRCKDVDLEAW